MSATKRRLDFHTADEVIAEIDRLRTGGYDKLKNWNLTQNCEHLTATMLAGLEGMGTRMPRILRVTVFRWIFAWMLRRRKMLSAPTAPELRPTSPGDTDDDAIIDRCIETLRRAAARDQPIDRHPLLENMPATDWQQINYIHAAHHLGFLQPKSH